MEQQLTIFDELDRLDAVEGKEVDIYEECLVPGLRYEPPTGHLARMKNGYVKIVTHEKTRKKLFCIMLERVKSEKSNTIRFLYESLDGTLGEGYWGGNHLTDDPNEIKRSIMNVSKDILREGEEI